MIGPMIVVVEREICMKKLLLMFAFLIIASAGANSRSSYTYVGLFADEAHANNMWVWYTGSTTEFDTWVWWLPSSRGLHAVTFQLWIPSIYRKLVSVSRSHAELSGAGWDKIEAISRMRGPAGALGTPTSRRYRATAGF